MGLTRTEKKAAVKHILEMVFDQDPDSPLHKAFIHAGIASPYDLIAMDDDDLDMLQYLDSLDNLVVLLQGNAGLLKAFKAFVMHHANTGNPISDSIWIIIT